MINENLVVSAIYNDVGSFKGLKMPRKDSPTKPA
jgi:hypothetical protein